MNDLILYLAGETETTALAPFSGPGPCLCPGPVLLDTFGGKIHVEWDPQAVLTPLRQLPFFTECLQVSGRPGL